MSLFSQQLVGDGYCDDHLNIPECLYDGYDCCDINSNFNLCSYCICHEIHLTTEPFNNLTENTTLDEMIDEEDIEITLYILSFNQSSSTFEATSSSTSEKTSKKSTSTGKSTDYNEGENSCSRLFMKVILYPILILVIFFW